MDKGYILLHRKLMDHVLFKEKRKFSKFEAWIDILFRAGFKENSILINNQEIVLGRGELLTSEVKLAERWGWSRNTVRKYLTFLENEKMIVKNCTAHYTALTVVKYEDYQNTKQRSKQHLEQHLEQAVNSSLNTNKECNNTCQIHEEERYISCQSLKMSETEYEKLCAKFGKAKVDDKLEYAENYKPLVKNYVSLYRTLNNWLKKDAEGSDPHGRATETERDPKRPYGLYITDY